LLRLGRAGLQATAAPHSSGRPEQQLSVRNAINAFMAS
jgi:hypothetical protein